MEEPKEKQVCLWCKSEHLIVIHGEDENDDKYYAVGCQDCGADGPHTKRSKGKRAAWEAYKSGANVSHAEIQEMIEKLEFESKPSKDGPAYQEPMNREYRNGIKLALMHIRWLLEPQTKEKG